MWMWSSTGLVGQPGPRSHLVREHPVHRMGNAPAPDRGFPAGVRGALPGRRLAYTYEIVELVPNERLVMRTQQGPFPMETTSTWEAVDAGKTRMTLRNRGTPSGFSRLAAPLMARAIQR